MERIGREVEKRLAQTGGGEGRSLAEITAVWPATVGDGIARNAWPLRMAKDGTLHVATASATWAFELDRMSLEISERLTAILGERAPRALRFRVGPVPEPGPEPGSGEETESPSQPPETTPEATAAAASAAALIDDPDLRKLVARAARASLGRAPSTGPSDRGFW